MSPFVSRASFLLALLLVPVAGASAQGLGQSFGGLQVQGDQPIAIESDQLDVDDRQAVATFSGAVTVQQGEMRLSAGRLVVHYVRSGEEEGAQPASTGNMPGGGSDIRRLEASGDVEIQSAEQVATADRADFDMASQVATLTGNVVLSQGPNVATGCRLTIQMETGVARLQSTDCAGGQAPEAGGRVRMLLTPGSQNQ